MKTIVITKRVVKRGANKKLALVKKNRDFVFVLKRRQNMCHAPAKIYLTQFKLDFSRQRKI